MPPNASERARQAWKRSVFTLHPDKLAACTEEERGAAAEACTQAAAQTCAQTSAPCVQNSYGAFRMLIMRTIAHLCSINTGDLGIAPGACGKQAADERAYEEKEGTSQIAATVAKNQQQ